MFWQDFWLGWVGVRSLSPGCWIQVCLKPLPGILTSWLQPVAEVISHTLDFSEEYRKMGFTRRLLQNSLPGMIGLIYLSIGRNAYQRKFATQLSGLRTARQTKAVDGAIVLAASVVPWVVALMLQL